MVTIASFIFLFVSPTNQTSPYTTNTAGESAAVVGLFVLQATVEGLVKPTLSADFSRCRVTDSGYCDPRDLLSFDRAAVNNHSQAWEKVSDLGQIVGVSLPLIASAIDFLPTSQGFGAFVSDSLVIYEAVAAASILTMFLKLTIQRPRPYQYRLGAQPGSIEKELSFPSGHTSSVAAALTAYTTTYFLHYPGSPSRFVVAGGALITTSLTAYGRVGAGKHFYSDVFAGALLGGVIGYVVPVLHLEDNKSVQAHFFINSEFGSHNTHGLALTLHF